MKKLTLLLFIFLTSLFWAQDKNESMELTTTSHKVVSGETVLNISKKYGVDPSVLYRNNRFAVDSINQGMILTFPAPKLITPATNPWVVTQNEPEQTQVLVEVPMTEKEQVVPEESAATERFHKVQSGETLYSLSKKYVCTIEELKKLNPQLNQLQLQIGQVLAIPVLGTVVENPSYKSGETIKHTVQPKETLYGLSKKYGVSVAAIQKQNQAILKKGLQVNQILSITIN